MSDFEEPTRRWIVSLLRDELARLEATIKEEEAKGIPDHTYYTYLSGLVHGVARVAFESGEHIDGLREGGGATRSGLGNRPPHHLRDDDE